MFIFNFEFHKNSFKKRKGEFLTLDVLMPLNQFNLLSPFYLFPSKAQNSTSKFKTNSQSAQTSVLSLTSITAAAFAWLRQQMNICGHKSTENSPSFCESNCTFYCTIESNMKDGRYFLNTIQNQKVSTEGFIRYTIKSPVWDQGNYCHFIAF